VCLYVCLSARVSQKSRVQTSRKFLYVLSGAAGPWIGPIVVTSGFVDGVVFTQWALWCVAHIYVSAVMEQVIISFKRIPSAGGTTLFDFAVVHNGSKWRTAAIGWWPVACGIIKAGGEVCCLRLPCCCYCYWRMVYRSGVGDSCRRADGPRIGSSASICCPRHCQKVAHRCQFSFLSSVYLMPSSGLILDSVNCARQVHSIR